MQSVRSAAMFREGNGAAAQSSRCSKDPNGELTTQSPHVCGWGRKFFKKSISFVRLTCALEGSRTDEYRSYLPHQRFQFCSGGGQADAEGDCVWKAGDTAGDDGPFHGEGQHGVDHKHNEQKERHLQAESDRKCKKTRLKWGVLEIRC